MQVGTLRRLSVAEFASGAILSAKWPIMRPLNRGPAASTPARRPLFSLSIFLGEDGVVGRVRGQLRGHVGGGSPPLDVLHAGMVGPLQRHLGAPGSPTGVRKQHDGAPRLIPTVALLRGDLGGAPGRHHFPHAIPQTHVAIAGGVEFHRIRGKVGP